MNLLRKIISVTVSILLLSCNLTSNQNKYEPKKPISDYPEIIDSLGLHQLYDSTKWQLYLLVALDTPKYDDKYDQGEHIFDSTISYAKLELRFDSLYIDDTGCVKLYFEFYINDTQSINPWDIRGMKGYYNGMEYNLKNSSDTIHFIYLDKFRSYGFGKWGYYITNKSMIDIDTTIIKTIYPLQPDVIEYLNKHKNEIHPWLYREGVKRGVIKE